MNTNFKLRLGTADDLDLLFPIYMDPKVNRFLNFEIMSKDEFKPLFKDFLTSQLYVYEHERMIVATCIVMQKKRRANHVVTLGALATHPQFQGQGIGTRFIKELIEKLKQDGIKRVDLCVEADNRSALSFYQKLGFQVEGVLKKYFKRPYEDEYIDEYMMAMIFD